MSVCVCALCFIEQLFMLYTRAPDLRSLITNYLRRGGDAEHAVFVRVSVCVCVCVR